MLGSFSKIKVRHQKLNYQLSKPPTFKTSNLQNHQLQTSRYIFTLQDICSTFSHANFHFTPYRAAMHQCHRRYFNFYNSNEIKAQISPEFPSTPGHSRKKKKEFRCSTLNRALKKSRHKATWTFFSQLRG